MEQRAVEAVETVQPPMTGVRKPWSAPTLTVSSVEEVTLTGGFDNSDGNMTIYS